jgi:hypothetical protein
MLSLSKQSVLLRFCKATLRQAQCDLPEVNIKDCFGVPSRKPNEVVRRSQ